MKPLGLFVTGTDTGVGKTVVAAALIQSLIARGLHVAAMKPVASGCELTPQGLRNSDAVRLRQCSNVSLRYEAVNPYAFAPAIAPHIAAAEAATHIDLAAIKLCFMELADRSDLVIVEGVGGWLVPLASELTVADLALELGQPVVLVVGVRLGCLNHALLSARAIAATGLIWAGWVANLYDPGCARVRENIDALSQRLPPPLLGVIPTLEDRERDAGRYLDAAVLKAVLDGDG